MARSIDRKLQLARSFIELLDELPIEQINVTMVAQRSGLSRQTFYYHFRCIEDLTNWTAHQVILRTVAPYRDSSWQVWLRAVLDMLYANRSLVLKVAAEDGRDRSIKVFKEEIGLLIMRIVEDASAGMGIAPSDRAMIARFYTAGLTEIIQAWIDDGMREKPDRLTERVEMLLANSSSLLARFVS